MRYIIGCNRISLKMALQKLFYHKSFKSPRLFNPSKITYGDEINTNTYTYMIPITCKNLIFKTYKDYSNDKKLPHATVFLENEANKGTRFLNTLVPGMLLCSLNKLVQQFRRKSDNWVKKFHWKSRTAIKRFWAACVKTKFYSKPTSLSWCLHT